MSLHLPLPIDLYVKLENSGDTEALSECFAPEAAVHDEGQIYRGVASITKWKAEAKKKYNHTITPLEVTSRDGKAILKAKLSGNFPGSPVTLTFSFALDAGKIASLEI